MDKRATLEAMAANIASMLSNIGRLAKFAADEIEASYPRIAPGTDPAQRKKNRAALISALRTLEKQFPKG